MVLDFEKLYEDNLESQKERYRRLQREFEVYFGKRDRLYYFSSPGRSEICGNHQDHNRGKVLTAAITLDIIAAVAPTNNNTIRLKSLEYGKIDIIDTSDKNPKDKEAGHSAAMIRGIASRCSELGYKVGGFDAFTISHVLKGSGLSSSAAFEMLVVTIISHLFNEGKITPLDASRIATYSENNYYGKPCGMQDPTAISFGGFSSIDFLDPVNPKIEAIDFDFSSVGYSLCIVDVGHGHAKMMDDFASVPAEMIDVAVNMGEGFLRNVDEAVFYQKINQLRAACGDRAVLRAMHFFEEIRRVDEAAQALKDKDFEKFLQIELESGRSSALYLQNLFSNTKPQVQGLTIALALSEKMLAGRGAWRVHGGGFGGTMQAYVPNDMLELYKKNIDRVFGENACHVLSLRKHGSAMVNFEG